MAAAALIGMEQVERGPITAVQGSMNMTDIMCVVMTLGTGLRQGHRKAHPCIRPSDMLIGPVEDVPMAKLGDFGGGRVQPEGKMKAERMILDFPAPELLSEEAGTARLDVHSLGLVISYVMTGTCVLELSKPLYLLVRGIVMKGGVIELPDADPVLPTLRRVLSVNTDDPTIEAVCTAFYRGRFALGKGVDV
jgi:hypothetical protein